MNILITNSALKNGSGTETFVRDLAVKLQALGHYPMVYCSHIGNIADEVMNTCIPVVTDLHRLPRKPDIIHGHHHIQTIDALTHFNGVPGIFVCHDRVAKHDVPPLYERIYFYVAVDHNCRERFVYSNLPDKKIRVIYNSVDTDKFLSRPKLPSRPQRALVFSYALTSNEYLKAISSACKELNIKLDIACTEAGTGSQIPQDMLGWYDLVFAKARCAMEAMAVGAAVILSHKTGLGPMVTMAEIEALRPWNFGMRCLKHPIDKKTVIEQIKRYNAEEASAVSRYMRENATLSAMASAYLELYQEVLSMAPDNKMPVADEVKRYIDALALQTEKSRLALSLHKVIEIKYLLKQKAQYVIKIGRKIIRAWRKIIGTQKPLVKKVLKNSARDRLKSIDQALVKISLAETILLQIAIANDKGGK